MNVLIIIPTYNEALNIKELILEIKKNLCDSYNYRILVVDDNSSDNTAEIVCEFEDVFLLQRPEKFGLASAYIDGFKFGLEKNFDAFIQMDADFSHNPEYLPQMFKLLSDNDFVIASRNIKNGEVEGWGLCRKLISKGGSIYSKIVLNCSINDFTGGFNGWKREVLEKIGLDNIISKGYCFQIEMKYRAYKNHFKFVEFPIIFQNRRFGKSKMTSEIFFEALLNILKLRFIK